MWKCWFSQGLKVDKEEYLRLRQGALFPFFFAGHPGDARHVHVLQVHHLLQWDAGTIIWVARQPNCTETVSWVFLEPSIFFPPLV